MITCLSPNGPMVHNARAVPSRLLVATMDGVAILDRDARGSGWAVARIALTGVHVSSLLFEPSRDGVFAGTHGRGIFFSADHGETWSAVSGGPAQGNVFSLGCSVRDGQVTLLAGTEPVMLFSSNDYGRTWREHSAIAEMPDRDKWTFPAPPHIAHLKSIAVHPAEPDVYYACIEQGALLKTADAGRTWREIVTYARPTDRWYRDIHKVVPAASDPRRLWMSTGVGVYRSEDAGNAWEKLTGDDFPIAYPDHLIVSPGDEDTVFVVGASTTPDVWRQTHAAKSVVMCSRDGGKHWRLASTGLPVNGRAAVEAMGVASVGATYELFVGNTDGEVYTSRDQAGSWQLATGGLAPISKPPHAKYLT
jgi:photosystem II stability/assembly factor-like uncharacterized protein